MMKKLFLAALLAILGPNLAQADQITSGSFKGLNANESPVIIGPEYAQDLLNVDVTPGGKSVKKRSGYGLYKALGTGYSVNGIFHSYNGSGQDVVIAGSSTSLYGITADGTPVQLVSSATLNAVWDCTDTQANSYCVNSSRDVYLRTDGSTITWNTSPLGTMVESTPDRVVVAGVTGALNTLYVSQSNTFTNFTTGVNPTDAFTEVIASPGSRLTHIRWGCGKLLWWKDASFGYFDFDDQYTAQVKTVSDTIGTIDNTSAIDPGGQVWFRGQDGHTWKYDCSILTKESIDISPFAESAGRRTPNTWSQTSASDFNDGSNLWTDTTTVSGQITLTGSSNNFASSSTWTPTCSALFHRTIIQTTPTSGLSTNGMFSEASVLFGSATQAGIGLMKTTGAGAASGYIAVFGTSGGTIGASFRKAQASGDTASAVTSTAISTPAFDPTTYHALDFEFRQLTGGLFAYVDGVLVSSATDTSITGLTRQSFFSACTAAGTDGPALFQASHLTSSSGTYSSAVHNAPDLVGWGTMSANQALNGGTETFYMRSSTNSFTVNSTTPSWTAQTSGNTISISTGIYFQLRDDFAVTSGSQTPTLYDFTINWTEGLVSDQSSMLYFDNAIWESVPYGPGQFTSNYIFKFDLINEGWTLYDFGTGGMIAYNNTLYFGDTDAGNIFSFGNSASDNGTAIHAFWKSKDYSGPDPFLQTQLTNVDSFARKNSGTSLSVSYVMDTSTTTTYSMSLTNNTQSIIQSRKLLPSGKLGQVFNIQYGDTSTTSQWEFLGYRIGFLQQPYRPTQ